MTTEERIALLETQMQALTTPPEDYYTSQYSGEEIDAGITAAAGAVRYNAAQALTAAQKTQARGNIGAAPDGYGLGAGGKYISNATLGSLDTIEASGWYNMSMTRTVTVCGVTFAYAFMLVNAVDSNNANQILYPIVSGSPVIVRTLYGGKWQPYEILNPPMKPGVEYRTIERYLGKPVYIKVVDCGALPAAGTTKNVAYSSGNTLPISVALSYGNMSSDTYFITGYKEWVASSLATPLNISIIGGSAPNTTANYKAYATVKYTKTTD